LKEKKLYPIVEKFLKTSMGCYITGIQKGSKDLGQIDVAGIRNIGGRSTNQIEIISVEVKLNNSNIVRKLGEAAAYSVGAHRCYLAIPERFREEHKVLASKLGVGLIEIKGKKVLEVLSSPQHTPYEDRSSNLIWSLEGWQCLICKNVSRGYFSKKAKEVIKDNCDFEQSRNNKNILFTTRREKKQWFYVCKDCAKIINKLGQVDVKN
jgi:hypothetical protein